MTVTIRPVLSLIALAGALTLLPTRAEANDYVLVRAAEACQGMDTAQNQARFESLSHGVIQAKTNQGQHFWCRVQVPDGKWISEINAYGQDSDGGAAITVELRRAYFTSRVSSKLYDWTSATGQTTWTKDQICHQVNTTNYSYWIHVYIPTSASVSNLELWSFDFYVEDSAC